MEKKTKKKKKAELKVWPYLTGKPVEGQMLLTSLKFFLFTFVLMLAFLILGAMMMWKNVILRVITNSALLLVAYAVYYQSGLSSGTGAVNLGEILYQRKETNRDITEKELSWSYHPAKGFLTALIGSVPVFLCAVVFSLTAQKVMTAAGALPSWISTLERREEIGDALIVYHQSGTLNAVDMLRLIIRMAIMPMVNIIGVENKDAILVLERCSPVLVLIPALCYGLGYLGGVGVRSRVHADIEAGKRKIKRRQKREREQRRQQRQRQDGPGQLN